METRKEINENQGIKPRERQIIKLMRELNYGHLIISVKNSRSAHAEIQKSITLTP